MFSAILGLDKQKQKSASEKVIVVRYFMGLSDRKNQFASELPLGSQRALAISIDLVSEPKLMLMDEPSLGLAPVIVQEVAGILLEINK